MAGKFAVIRGRNSQFYFHLTAGNNQIILVSEGYNTKASAEGGIASVRANAPIDSQYERKQRGESYTFVLTAANGELIGRSESYTSAASRDNGIESVKANATGAPVADL